MKMRIVLVPKINTRKQIWIGQKRANAQRPSKALCRSESLKIKLGNRGTVFIFPISRSISFLNNPKFSKVAIPHKSFYYMELLLPNNYFSAFNKSFSLHPTLISPYSLRFSWLKQSCFSWHRVSIFSICSVFHMALMLKQYLRFNYWVIMQGIMLVNL